MNTTATRHLARLGALGLSAAVLVPALAAPASAKDPEVRTAGDCSASSDWKLKVKKDDGRLEVEAEVDSNVTGQAWTWRLSDNGTRFARGTSTTRGVSGSFEVERRTDDLAGADTVTLVATFGSETCRGTATL